MTDKPLLPPSTPHDTTIHRVRRSRIGRLAMLGRMGAGLAGAAVGAAGQWATTTREQATEALHRKAAERLLASLGEMKGLPMKLGQLYSYLDGAVPPQYQHLYDETLGRLRTRVKPVAWPAMRAVLYEELGPQADQVHFATFDTTPIAAASIGQVYRATLPGGHPVAVKLQYPGIREAIQSDLANVEGLLSAASVVLPRMHVEQGLADITARIEEECDYTQERAHYERFAQIWTDDPVVRIPATHPQLCTTRALVTDFIDGQTWEEAVPNMHQEGRNHVGQTLFRFVFQTLYGHGLFNADPHPGNVLFLPGGSIAFLDFGCVQSYTPETRDAIREIRDAIVEQADEATVKTLTQRAFQVPDVFDDDMWALLVRTMRLCFEPLAAPQPFRFTRDYTAGITQMVMDAKMVAARRLLSTGIQEPKMEGFVFLTRIIFGLSSLLARLEAQADWLELTYQCEAKHAHR